MSSTVSRRSSTSSTPPAVSRRPSGPSRYTADLARLRASLFSPNGPESSGSEATGGKKQSRRGAETTRNKAAANVEPSFQVEGEAGRGPVTLAKSLGSMAVEGSKSAVRLLGLGARAVAAQAVSLSSLDEQDLSAALADTEAEQQQQQQQQRRQVSVKSFLKDVSQDTELLRNFRFMSSMSEQAYYTGTLTAQDTRLRWNLELVQTSEDYKAAMSELSGPSREEVFEVADGMGVCPALGEEIAQRQRQEMEAAAVDLEKAYGGLGLEQDAPEGEGEGAALAFEDHGDPGRGIEGSGAKAQGVVEIALDTAKGLASFVAKGLNPQGSDASAEASDAETAKGGAKSSASARPRQDNDPCEWIVCDTIESSSGRPTRYIALQGSDSVDHWVTNLSFDPVDFEGGDLNVKIHAGIYKAAEKLLSQLMPAIEEHLEEHGDNARLVFTGHSLGGAIASCLVMMLVHRGMVSRESVGGVYTIGCPAFLSEHCSDKNAGDNARLLRRLDLPSSTFRHLCMHRDIVPRAFACDYTMITNILGRMETFRDHGCLKGDKEKNYAPSMYEHVGDIYFLQPDKDYLQFARPEGDSPMLPEGPGIWKMVEPPKSLKLAMDTMNRISSSLQNEWAFGDSLELYTYASDMNHAIDEIFNNPHPVETLKRTQAYGHEGGVSRYHKPKNYTRAIGVLLAGKGGSGEA